MHHWLLVLQVPLLLGYLLHPLFRCDADHQSTFSAIESMSKAENFPTPITVSWCIQERGLC